jgi:hypothetical protein
MSIGKNSLIRILLGAIFVSTCACVYIVTPEVEVTPTSQASTGWNALVTNVGKSEAGDLHVDITIRNDTSGWSAMQAIAGRPAVLTTGDGKNVDCATVFVGTGSNYLAPGFQMRGYTAGSKTDPQTQLLYVECKGATADAGAKLTIEYSYVTGDFNYYVAAKPVNAEFVLSLDQVTTDLTYPIAKPVDGLIEKAGNPIEAINKVNLTLTSITRTDTGLEFNWETNNPGEYPTYVHIGLPPVIGADGIIYGFYESPNLADAPITLPGQKANWTTTVIVPQDATGLYILLSVESKQQKRFVSHVVDITDK